MISLFCFFAFSSSRIFIFISSYFCLPCLAHTHDNGHLLFHSTLHALPSRVCFSVSMLQLPEFRWVSFHSTCFWEYCLCFLSFYLSFHFSFFLSFITWLWQSSCKFCTSLNVILPFVQTVLDILLFCSEVYCSTKSDAILLSDCICLLSFPLQLFYAITHITGSYAVLCCAVHHPESPSSSFRSHSLLSNHLHIFTSHISS